MPGEERANFFLENILKIYFISIALACSVALLAPRAMANDGVPVKYLSSCQMDLNNDNELDLVFFVETVKGPKLIALLKTSRGYSSCVVSRDNPNMNMSCQYGKMVMETSAGKEKRTAKSFATPGAYIELKQPEGAAVAYFWNGNGFTEVWTSD
jgi:hypothetical protein